MTKLLITTVILLIATAAFAQTDSFKQVEDSDRNLTVNLENGSLGSLKVGDYADLDRLMKVIGDSPDEIEDVVFYKYFKFRNKGIRIHVKDDRILEFNIYYKSDVKIDGEYNQFNGSIEGFNNEETIDTVESKLGVNYERDVDLIFKYPVIEYKKAYGGLVMNFDDKDKLLMITMYAD